MQLFHIALAVLVMALWGFNFVVIHLGLQHFPPILLCSLRYLFASVPLIFFLRKPQAPFKMILLYGLVTFALQYLLLFMGMQAGMPAGLASVLYQTQVFFTIIFASVFFQEKPTLFQIIGILVACLGILVIGLNLGGSLTLLGFILTIAGAIAWALSNIITKYIGKVNMLSLVVWGNFVSWPPVLLLSILLEGTASIQQNLLHPSWEAGISILYIAYLSTLVCFSIWTWLLHRYPVSTIIPFTLTVPIFGMLGSYIVSHEPIQLWKILAGALIVGGLLINLLGARLMRALSANLSPKTESSPPRCL